MNTNIDNNYEFRYELLSLGMGDSPYYLSPATGYREYFREIWGWYQPTPETPVIPLSDDGKLRELIVVFKNHALELLEGTVASVHNDDLVVIDPRCKSNAFSGKLLFIGKLQNDTVLVKIADATGETPKSISLCFDRYSFSEVQDFLLFIMKQFQSMASGDMEKIVQEYQQLFISSASDPTSEVKT